MGIGIRMAQKHYKRLMDEGYIDENWNITDLGLAALVEE